MEDVGRWSNGQKTGTTVSGVGVGGKNGHEPEVTAARDGPAPSKKRWVQGAETSPRSVTGDAELMHYMCTNKKKLKRKKKKKKLGRIFRDWREYGRREGYETVIKVFKRL